jgi:hypothetical protein
MKQVTVVFEFPTATQKQYESVWDDLKASGNSHPKGLLVHVAARGKNGGLFVTDVWESEQAFKEFGNVLMPFIQKSGVGIVEPQILETYNVYEAKHVEELS